MFTIKASNKVDVTTSRAILVRSSTFNFFVTLKAFYPLVLILT
nr:MAG TPA: hypothetical protein [Caudoviricetes sp.]